MLPFSESASHLAPAGPHPRPPFHIARREFRIVHTSSIKMWKCRLVDVPNQGGVSNQVTVVTSLASNNQQPWILVFQLPHVLGISLSTVKTYLERHGGTQVVRDKSCLKVLREIGSLGTKSASITLFPLPQLSIALQSCRGVDMDFVSRLSHLIVGPVEPLSQEEMRFQVPACTGGEDVQKFDHIGELEDQNAHEGHVKMYGASTGQ
jgi:hypothetical protein